MSSAVLEAGVARRCPLVWWGIAYCLSFPMADSLLRVAKHAESFPYALVVSLVASTLGSVVFEIALKRRSQCSIDLWSKRSRGALFVGALAAGLFVVYPGTAVLVAVDPAFRMISAFGVGCILAALAHHIALEHREGVRQPVLRILTVLVRTPLWVLLGIVLILVVVGIGEMIYSALER